MTSLTTFGTIFNTVWSLIFIAPLYIVLATVLSQSLIYLHQVAKNRSSFIYRYLGDVSWAIPFTGQNEFRITQVLLVAITLVLLSLLILGFMIYSTYGEQKYQATKKRLLEEITKEQDKINKEEQANAAERREQEDREKEQKSKENENRKREADKVTQEMKRKRQQELEEMMRQQELSRAEEMRYAEERRNKLDEQKKQ